MNFYCFYPVRFFFFCYFLSFRYLYCFYRQFFSINQTTIKIPLNPCFVHTFPTVSLILLSNPIYNMLKEIKSFVYLLLLLNNFKWTSNHISSGFCYCSCHHMMVSLIYVWKVFRKSNFQKIIHSKENRCKRESWKHLKGESTIFW